ncbi:hypothetical protein [Hephaestia caeni]|uniref:hypothetical protein n=1 Tax=Hephaestia caeni TaxID=645617 RepID=UPI001FE6E8E3|nr:hypothetical protein [Hephaestia caeni]
MVLLLSTVAACGQRPAGEQARNTQSDAQSIDPAADDHIFCALDGAAGFTRDCTIDHDGDTITVRNPDGGFHRFVIAGDGSVSAADGAEAAQVTARTQGMSEVSIGGDRYRYRLPATP